MNRLNAWIGRELRNIRIKDERTQLDIANAMGWESHQMVGYIERGICKIPSNRIYELAQAYRTDPTEFFLVINMLRWVNEDVPSNLLADLLYRLSGSGFDPQGTSGASDTSHPIRDTGGDNGQPAVSSKRRWRIDPGGLASRCLQPLLRYSIEKEKRKLSSANAKNGISFERIFGDLESDKEYKVTEELTSLQHENHNDFNWMLGHARRAMCRFFGLKTVRTYVLAYR